MVRDCFPENGKRFYDRLSLKMYFSRGTRTSKQPLVIRHGRTSSPADLKGFGLFMAIKSSAIRIGNKDKLCKEEASNNLRE
jgi:hypothetical protein